MNGVEAVQQHLRQVPATEVGIPIVAVAELLFGAHKSRRRDENLRRVRALRRAVETLPLTEAVVERYGATRAALEAVGQVESASTL